MDRCQAAMWLLLLMPTKKFGQLPRQEVNRWLAEWLELWDQRVGSALWDQCWMALMARLAKDDVTGEQAAGAVHIYL